MRSNKIIENAIEEARKEITKIKEKQSKLIITEMPYKVRVEKEQLLKDEEYKLLDIITQLTKLS